MVNNQDNNSYEDVAGSLTRKNTPLSIQQQAPPMKEIYCGTLEGRFPRTWAKKAHDRRQKSGTRRDYWLGLSTTSAGFQFLDVCSLFRYHRNECK